jgi:hypothetical protein
MLRGRTPTPNPQDLHTIYTPQLTSPISPHPYAPNLDLQSPALYITAAETGCWSYVGMLSGHITQGFNLQSPGCDTLGTAIHEMGHAVCARMPQTSECSRTLSYQRILGGEDHF